MNSLSRPVTHQRYLLILLLFLHTVNTYMDRVCISSAKNEMQEDISGLSDQMMGYSFGIFAVGYALFQIPSGWLSDRVGPRIALTLVVVLWSVFTAMTGAVFTAVMLIVVRFLFGVGEAGAYPGATRALYGWLPARERGIGQGIFHSGARVGAAFSLVAMPVLIEWIGWRWTFAANAGLGFLWAGVWWFWFRDNPREHPWTSDAEVEHIESEIEEPVSKGSDEPPAIPYIQIVTSANVLLAMCQYAASNVTFFFSITWLRPYMEDRWGEEAANLSAVPLLFGAVALWFSGWLVTHLYRLGFPVGSRRIPAMMGFGIGALGLLLCTSESAGRSPVWFTVFFTIAIFGVEMILSPSWSFCMDLGGRRSGAVSGSMNMVGNLGAALSAVIFPFFRDHVTIPWFAESTGTANSFFVFAAAFNLLALFCWTMMNSHRKMTEHLSPVSLAIRVIGFVGILILVVAAVVYTQIVMK